VHRQGVAASFDQARAAFDAAWQDCLPNRTEAGFQAWRDQQAGTARKYALGTWGQTAVAASEFGYALSLRRSV